MEKIKNGGVRKLNFNNKLGVKEAVFFILIVVINKIILNLPKSIIKQASTGAILNIIEVGIIVLVITYIVSLLFKSFQNHDIIDISEYLGGKVLKNIIGLSYIIFFSLIICVVLLKFINIIKTIYFQNSPYIYIALFFIFTISISNYLGKRAILKANALIVPIIIFSLIIIFFGINTNIDINRLFPIMGTSIKNTFVDGLGNIYAFGRNNIFNVSNAPIKK